MVEKKQSDGLLNRRSAVRLRPGPPVSESLSNFIEKKKGRRSYSDQRPAWIDSLERVDQVELQSVELWFDLPAFTPAASAELSRFELSVRPCHNVKLATVLARIFHRA